MTSESTPRDGRAPSVLADLADARRRLTVAPLVSVPTNPRSGATHPVAALVLIPVLAWLFHAAAGSPAWADLSWAIVVLALAIPGALVLASYLPRPAGSGGSAPASSPCSRIAGLHIIFALLLVASSPTLGVALVAVIVEIGAMEQRRGRTCPTP